MRVIRLVARSVFARLWYRALKKLPVPSETKWSGLTELLALVSSAGLELDGRGRARRLSAMQRIMDQVGKQWMSKRAGWVGDSAAPIPAVAELLTLAFKTLNIPTAVQAQPGSIRATTFRCPFVENADCSSSARKICHMVCSDTLSLFHGFGQGLPIPLGYYAPRKMGWGDPVCVKDFQLQTDYDDQWQEGSSQTKELYTRRRRRRSRANTSAYLWKPTLPPPL